MMSEQLKNILVDRLCNDSELQFKLSGRELRNGLCPACGQRELFIKLDQPFRVQCRRANKCAWSSTTRELYPDLFENFSKRHPATDKNPNATADAYMTENRGFDLAVIKDMYFQGNAKHRSKNEYYPAVKVIISQTCYWLRIIDADDVRRNDGAKAKINGPYQGNGWIPPGMTFEEGDTIFITEGIFKSMAFLHLQDAAGKPMKSISSLSSSNLPRNIIKANAGKKITWVLAEDHDRAGIHAAEKFRDEINRLGERCLVALPTPGYDWDDEFRAGRLNEKYLQESYWRGWYELAGAAAEKAFWHYARYRRSYHVFACTDALWKYKIDEKNRDEDVTTGRTGRWDKCETGDQLTLFYQFAKIERISNVLPEFQYIERDALTDEQFYNFRFTFSSGNPAIQAAFDGSALESPAAFNKTLLTRTPGGTFDGSAADLKHLRDFWFNHKINYVKTVPYIGYDRDTGAYVFPEFGYLKGRRLDVNEQSYMVAGKEHLKCGLRSVTIAKATGFDPTWITDFQDAFSLNGLALMSWWLGSLFAEQIRDKYYSWPFLEYTGDQGAGKSTQIEFMWRCCGRDNYEGFDPSKSTHVGRSRNFQQVANLPVVLLEGDRSGDQPGAKKAGFDMDELKTAYNGRGIRAMGVKKRGAETDEPLFRGAILVSQNASVDGSDALLARIVHCHCTREHFTRETEIKARRLAGLSVNDLSGWLDAALKNETALLDGFFKKFTELETAWKEHKGIQNRLVLNHAQVAAWAWQLPVLFGSHLVSTDLCQRLQDHIWQRCADRQGRLAADHPLVEQFWDVFEYLNYKVDARGEKLQTINHSTNHGEIAISLPHFQEVANNHNMDRLPLGELKRLLPICRSHKFLGQRKVRSAISDTIIHCWIFEDKKQNSTS